MGVFVDFTRSLVQLVTETKPARPHGHFELHQMHEISWGDIDHVFLFGPKQRKTILAILIKTYSLSM